MITHYIQGVLLSTMTPVCSIRRRLSDYYINPKHTYGQNFKVIGTGGGGGINNVLSK